VPENVSATVYARPKMSQRQPTGHEETPRQISDSPRGPGVSCGLITLTYGKPEAGTAWSSVRGRMPYIAHALLAGNGSTGFIMKLKELAQSLFAIQKEGGGD